MHLTVIAKCPNEKHFILRNKRKSKSNLFKSQIYHGPILIHGGDRTPALKDHGIIHFTTEPVSTCQNIRQQKHMQNERERQVEKLRQQESEREAKVSSLSLSPIDNTKRERESGGGLNFYRSVSHWRLARRAFGFHGYTSIIIKEGNREYFFYTKKKSGEGAREKKIGVWVRAKCISVLSPFLFHSVSLSHTLSLSRSSTFINTSGSNLLSRKFRGKLLVSAIIKF